MRPVAWLVLLLGASCALVALSCAQTDPDLSLPCDQRVDAGIRMGIGEYSYVVLGTDQGPFIDTDLNLGDFVWLGIGCTGLGPDVTVDYGIKDKATGADLSLVQGERVSLSYNSSVPDDEVAGLQALLDGGAFPYNFGEKVVGDAVTVWADVTDACHPTTPVHGETSTRIEGYDFATCPGCLDQECHAELAACGSECHAVQGCLDAYCVNLSALGSADEASCQAFCQGQHPEGKDAHVAVVACVQDMARGALCTTQTCLNNPVDGGTPSQFCYDQSPCYGFSLDYQFCVRTQEDPAEGACYNAFTACNASMACQTYKACTATCTTWAACQQCATSNTVGEELYEGQERCIEDTCLAQGWVIHVF